ncbi:MAG: PKD domain-containing protein [Saprospiraceae bacterium]|nr:PKD domain-containing protein [Saprospiraceae bacterium]
MKKLLLLITALIITTLGLTAQVVVNADITTNTTWTNNNIYLLQGGCLYVTNNATLTIEPGTIVKGDQAALIVTRGAKLIADGTPEQPIVFTSSKPVGQRAPGDWGGILLCGRAPINVPGGEATVEGGCSLALYGGTDAADNSGTLRYVRIEFAGIPFQPNNELNSLTMGGVGSGTTIEHVQTSYGGDDAYEWFGGTVNGKWLVAYATVDDIFDVDFGHQGKHQWLLGISDPAIADVSGSNGFETDNDAQGTTNEPKTDAHFSNVTILGPIGQAGTMNSNYKRAAHIRRCSYLDIFNSALAGFPFGLLLDGACTVDGFTTNDEVEFVANTLANTSGKNVTTTVAASLPAIFTEFTASGNDSLATVANLMLTDPFNFTGNPDFRPMAGSPLLSGANFTSPTLDAYFTPTTYRGAMGDTDWTDCWCEFNPTNANYDVAPINYITKPVITAGGATTFCSGGNVVLTAPAGFASYLWSNGATAQSITVSTAGSYTVTVTNARGCVSASDALAVTVNPTPVADFTFTVTGATVNFQNTSAGANTYLWDFGDGIISTAASLLHTYAAAGNYTVCLTANTTAGCTNQICKTANGVQAPTVVIINDHITSSATWTNNNIYVLQNGCLYVRDGVTLTIQPGTVIRGEAAALIVQRGAKSLPTAHRSSPSFSPPTAPLASAPPATGAASCCWAVRLSTCLLAKQPWKAAVPRHFTVAPTLPTTLVPCATCASSLRASRSNRTTS